MPQRDIPRRKILVVDDEPDIVDIVREHFEAIYEVHTALSGSRAIKLVRTVRPDLVLLDLRMPGLSGVDVLKTLRRMDPKLVVIIITANEDTDVAADAIAQGAFSYVPKPFDFASLDHLVAIALGNSG
jgi:DNA-binding NtrC family response regulator